MRKNLLLTGIALLAVGLIALPFAAKDEATGVLAEGESAETIYGAWHDNAELRAQFEGGWWMPETDKELEIGGVTWVGSAVRYNEPRQALEIMSEDTAHGLPVTSITERTDGSEFEKIGEAVLDTGENAAHRYNAIYTKDYVHIDKDFHIALDHEASGVLRVLVKFKETRPEQDYFVAGEWKVLKHKSAEAGMSLDTSKYNSFDGTNVDGDWNEHAISYKYGDGWGPGFFNYLAGYDVQIAIVHQSWSATAMFVKNVTIDRAQACVDLVNTWTATDTGVCDDLATENSVLRNTLIETQYGLDEADEALLAETAVTGPYGHEANVLAQLNYFNSVAGTGVNFQLAVISPLSSMNNSYIIVAVIFVIGCTIIAGALLKKKKAK